MFALLFVTALAIYQSPDSADDTRAINRAKNVIVQDLDKALPRITFEAWLRGLVAPKSQMTWEVNDCGEQTGSPADRDRDLPICVEVEVGLPGNRQLFLSLGVGSVRRGLAGTPAFHHGALVGSNRTAIVGITTLSQVPQRLADTPTSR